MSMFVLAAKLLFIDSYYFLLVQLLNDLYQQSLFVCSCSKWAQGSAIKHQQGINEYFYTCQNSVYTMWGENDWFNCCGSVSLWSSVRNLGNSPQYAKRFVVKWR